MAAVILALSGSESCTLPRSTVNWFMTVLFGCLLFFGFSACSVNMDFTRVRLMKCRQTNRHREPALRIRRS
jgi:hypothetical protein